MIAIALERRTRSDRDVMHRAGHAAAMRAVSRIPGRSGVPRSEISIEKDVNGKPHARTGGTYIPISIAHSGTIALGAAAADDAVLIGADIEHVRSFSPVVRDAFLTPRESAFIDAQPSAAKKRLETLAWVLKESTLKALGIGLHLNPRAVDCAAVLHARRSGRYSLQIRDKTVRVDVRILRLDRLHVGACIALPKKSLYCL